MALLFCMGFLSWLKVMIIGGLIAAALSVLSTFLDFQVRPARELEFLDVTRLVYLLLAIVGFAAGVLISAIALLSKSLRLTLVAGAIAGLLVSWGILMEALGALSSQVTFDREVFYADVLSVAINLTIFPVAGLLVFKIFLTRSKGALNG
ncbi:MAG TPA: hypothetical protein VGI80_06840 [Pyrinomonadaceae bacterium]